MSRQLTHSLACRGRRCAFATTARPATGLAATAAALFGAASFAGELGVAPWQISIFRLACRARGRCGRWRLVARHALDHGLLRFLAPLTVRAATLPEGR